MKTTNDEPQLREEPEPDIVTLMLQRVIALAPNFSAELARFVEEGIRAELGGRRVFVNKRAKFMTPEQRQAVFRDGLTGMSTPEITAKHKISRATLYRQMKKGGRFDPD